MDKNHFVPLVQAGLQTRFSCQHPSNICFNHYIIIYTTLITTDFYPNPSIIFGHHTFFTKLKSQLTTSTNRAQIIKNNNSIPTLIIIPTSFHQFINHQPMFMQLYSFSSSRRRSTSKMSKTYLVQLEYSKNTQGKLASFLNKMIITSQQI